MNPTKQMTCDEFDSFLIAPLTSTAISARLSRAQAVESHMKEAHGMDYRARIDGSDRVSLRLTHDAARDGQ